MKKEVKKEEVKSGGKKMKEVKGGSDQVREEGEQAKVPQSYNR